jgi:uroporphyrinogen-III synthase
MRPIYLLNDQKFEGIENLEVFNIQYLQSDIDLNSFDAILFTSKNGVYSLNSFNNQWKDIPSYSIAPKTANIIEKTGGKVKFIGNSGHGNDFANELLPILKDKKVLYVRALKVVSNLVQILKDNKIDIHELITYKTVCNKNLPKTLKDNAIIIFTSPSSIKCFFDRYNWNNNFKAIVIGKTTANYLPENIDYIISSTTSVQECVKLAFAQ